MKIGLYGMPTAGKTFLMEKIDFLDVYAGSKMLHDICPDFDLIDEVDKESARRKLANSLAAKDSFIMDGHYTFGDRVVFTENDGHLYDVFIYLYISPDVLSTRMNASDRNRRFLTYDISEWQKREIEELRQYCHENNKDFYVIDNPPDNVFDDVSDIIGFIKCIVGGYSCVSLAKRIADDIISKSKNETITLMDGDKTITIEDSSNKVFGYKTHIYDGNFYTGYQSWRQSKEFETYHFDEIRSMPVTLNQNVCKEIGEDTFILTSGHERVWSYIAKELAVPFYSGREMSAETKLYITKLLQTAGKTVTAYGDGMNDYYTMKQADRGFLVTKQDSSVSRSLKGRDLEGLERV